MKDIIKCRFLKDGEPMGREYSYLTNQPVAVGDIVQAETRQGEADLVVTAVNVPEEEVEAFKDKLKYIIGKKTGKPEKLELFLKTVLKEAGKVSLKNVCKDNGISFEEMVECIDYLHDTLQVDI